jgi:hypothetical protein
MRHASIYKLVSNIQNDDNVYIGSTENTLTKRKSQHKSSSKSKPHLRVYQYFNAIGWDNVSIIEVEAVEFNTRNELLTRERHFIDLMGNLNKVKPLQTMAEYAKTDEYRQYQAEYRKTDKYRQCQAEYAKTDKYRQYQAEYRKTDKYQQYQAEYAKTDQHKKYISYYNKTFHLCECGKSISNGSKYLHKKSKWHTEYQKIIDFLSL